MSDVQLVSSITGTGAADPATVSLAVGTGRLLLLIVSVLGTSPTLTTPTGYTQIQKTEGATLSFAMYWKLSAGGTESPSSTLGGTVTGWNAALCSFNMQKLDTGLAGSLMLTSSVAQLTDIFAGAAGKTAQPSTFFVYAVARPTATIITQNTGLAAPNGGESWNNPISISSDGLSTDLYRGTNLAKGSLYAPCQSGGFPSASGLLSSAVASVAIAAWFPSAASFDLVGVNVGGSEGRVNPVFYSGMVGG